MRVIKKLIGRHNGTVRFLLDSGSHVVAHADGRYTCIHSTCVTRGTYANRCPHVECVKAFDNGHDYTEQELAPPSAAATREEGYATVGEVSPPDLEYAAGMVFSGGGSNNYGSVRAAVPGTPTEKTIHEHGHSRGTRTHAVLDEDVHRP